MPGSPAGCQPLAHAALRPGPPLRSRLVRARAAGLVHAVRLRSARHAIGRLLAPRDDRPPARCWASTGLALAAAGDEARGVGQLERAEEALFDCDAFREADHAARELRRLGRRVTRRPRPDSGAGLMALSPREREVANEVAAGKTNRDVAATLFLSEKTVESHLARIYSKLDVHSRAALTAIIARQGGEAGPDERAI